MKALIVLNGELKSEQFLADLSEKADLIICADGGYDKAVSAGVVPDILLGDMDSVKNAGFTGKILKYPAEKDETDCELAIETARQNGANEIVLSCALGGRFDHALANASLLARNSDVCIQEPDCTAFCCRDHAKIENMTGKTMSLIPFEDSVITLTGVKYPTDRARFCLGSSFGISNVITENMAEITVHQGKTLVFINK